MIFFDTNIFVYSASIDPEDASRRAVARSAIATVDFALSTQVLEEFVNVALRKKRLGITLADIERMMDTLSAYPTAETSVTLVRQALGLSSRFQIRYGDAAILAAAQTLGCHTLYTEDLNHGQLYGNIRVVNPFL